MTIYIPASSRTASNRSFWEHIILAKGLVVLAFLESAVFKEERLILLPMYSFDKRNAASNY